MGIQPVQATQKSGTTHSQHAALSAEQIAHYREHGYIVVEDVVDKENLDELRKVTAEFIENSRAIEQSDNVYDIGHDHCAASPVVRRIKNPADQHPAYDKLMRSDAIVSIIADLIGPDIRFDHSKLNFKPPGGGAAIEWHQDWAFYPHTNQDILAVGVLLEDCNLDNGPLMVLPGSQNGPVYNHHHDGVFVGAIDLDTESIDVSDAVALTGKAGSITIHQVRMVHGSRENFSNTTRPLLLLSYAAVDAWPMVEKPDWDEFNSRILTGEATWAPRQEVVPVRIPLPGVPNSDSIFDDQQNVRGRSFAREV